MSAHYKGAGPVTFLALIGGVALVALVLWLLNRGVQADLKKGDGVPIRRIEKDNPGKRKGGGPRRRVMGADFC